MDFQERQALRNRSVTLACYCPMTLAEVIDRYADFKGWSGSETVLYLIREGLRVEATRAAESKL